MKKKPQHRKRGRIFVFLMFTCVLVLLARLFIKFVIFKGEYLQNTQIERQAGNSDQTGSSYGKGAENDKNPTGSSNAKKVTDDDWNLILVNQWNSLSEDYEIPLLEIGGGNAVDERCYSDLQNMLSACNEAGLEPLICSSFRSIERQRELFQERVDECLKGGYSKEEAEKMVEREIAYPGTSEHHLGLAFDIVDVRNQVLNEEQEKTEVQKWLIENSWKYGFILRYPNDKSEITGIMYEPWHYLYVGRDAAAEIFERGICLEEYLTEKSK